MAQLGAIALSVALILVPAATAAVIPQAGMVIRANTTFEPGRYDMVAGVQIAAHGVTLNLGGATLRGVANFSGVGISVLGFDGVRIVGPGTISGWYYGLRVEAVQGFELANVNASANWLDPNAKKGAAAPFLQIQVTPDDYGDRTNLGGGLWMVNVDDAHVHDNVLMNQENGLDGFYVHNARIEHNDASFNWGWGFHFFKSTSNRIRGNVANNCTRGDPTCRFSCITGDTSGLLLNCECHDNVVENNTFLHGGDGIFVTGYPRQGHDECCPSNNNSFLNNDCRFSPNNAIECTFAMNNKFIGNTVNESNYGLWLGYSHFGNVIAENEIAGCSAAGVAIDHGQSNEIGPGNTFIDNLGPDVYLWTDFTAPNGVPGGCLNLNNSESSWNTIHGNYFFGKSTTTAGGPGPKAWPSRIELVNTTNSLVYNNVIAVGIEGGDAEAVNGSSVAWNVPKTAGKNIAGGAYYGGNLWQRNAGDPDRGDGFGHLPYTNGVGVDDALPLVAQETQDGDLSPA